MKSRVFLTFNRNLIAIGYFFFIALFHRRTVIHFKQTHPGKLVLLKKIFRDRLVFITDLEGDKISEREYLLTVAQKVASFSSENKKAVEDLITEERKQFNLFDYIFVYNSLFEDLLRGRHSELKGQVKVSHLMSFKKDKLFFDEELRKGYRNKLGWSTNPIITYIGNVRYPWQNISKTIKIYKRIRDESNSNAKLLLLINKNDHPIAH